jgi:hypothetical protein
MNSKIIMPFSTMAIAAIVLLFASGPIVQNQQAFAVGYFPHYHHHFFFHHGFHR